MIVVFDAARENFRNKIYKNYKANRGDTPDDLIPQFEIIRECVDSFSIPQIEIDIFLFLSHTCFYINILY